MSGYRFRTYLTLNDFKLYSLFNGHSWDLTVFPKDAFNNATVCRINADWAIKSGLPIDFTATNLYSAVIGGSSVAATVGALSFSYSWKAKKYDFGSVLSATIWGVTVRCWKTCFRHKIADERLGVARLQNRRRRSTDTVAALFHCSWWQELRTPTTRTTDIPEIIG